MSKFVVLKVLLAATFFVAVASEGADKEVVFGKDVKGAIILSSPRRLNYHNSKQPEFSSAISYSSPYFKGIITKIVVVIEKLDDDATFEVNIKEGGIGKKNVDLLVLARNTSRLDYRVKIFGKNSAIN